MKVYKPNHLFYLGLLGVSILFVVTAVLIPINSKWFSIVTGVGGGGIASVIVAWLIDISSCNQRNRLNQDLLEQLFQRFDTDVKFELEWILKDYANRHPEIDCNHKYSITEIVQLVEKEDENLSEWVTHYHNIGVAFYSIDASVLLSYDPSLQHAKIYAELIQAQNMHNNYSVMNSMGKWECQDHTQSYEYSMLCFELCAIERIYSIRGEEKVFGC